MQRILFTLLISVAIFTACTTKAPYRPQISQQTINPGGEVRWLSKDVHLVGSNKVSLGQQLPKTKLKNQHMQDITLENQGKVQVISVVPSLDTPVCEAQTHKLAESKTLDSSIERITVSMDLPYAQARFKDESSLTNLSYFSDFAYKEFGDKLGLLVQEKGVLARALFVVDRRGVIRHMQIVPDVIQIPDMEKAFEVANHLVHPGKQAAFFKE